MKRILRKIYRKIFPFKSAKSNRLIEKYREFDEYSLDIEIFKGQVIHIDQKLPSEPPSGVTYKFGPSGYIGNPDSTFCVIPTTWKNVNNYCHWNFTELPFLFLAFESNAKKILLPDSIIDAKLPFQKRWLEILAMMYPEKEILRVSKTEYPIDALIPINHDTSSNTSAIGKCQYKHYHHSRATPYLIDRIDSLYKSNFKNINSEFNDYNHIYINRNTRRLKNESEIQKILIDLGFKIVNLEDLNLDEQIYIFSKAKTVVGFHGAGLSNILYANKTTQVFEIVDSDCVYPSYLDGVVIPGKKATRTYFHMLSVMKGIDYHVIESENYYLDESDFKNKLITAMN